MKENIMKSIKLIKTIHRHLIVMLGCLGILGFLGTPSLAQQKPITTPISAEFPFESRFIEVLGSNLHYVEKGQGDPILFIHGNPSSSYLWRNIMPYLEEQGRVIAVDLIGMGKSDKPDLDYTFADHIRYVEGFIQALDLKNITLVIHDWGSALGLDYASRHEDNVKGFAMMEALIPPLLPWESYEAMGDTVGGMFRTMRDPVQGPQFLVEQNGFIEMILPIAVVRDLTPQEMEAYRAPFLEKSSRKPVLVWPNEIPIGGTPENATRVIKNYSQWLMETSLPKLHIYASPGSLNPPQAVKFLQTRLRNYETAYVGLGIHFIQEDQPDAIGRALSDWYRRTQ